MKGKKANPIKDIDVSGQGHYKLFKSYAICSQGRHMDDINKKDSNQNSTDEHYNV